MVLWRGGVIRGPRPQWRSWRQRVSGFLAGFHPGRDSRGFSGRRRAGVSVADFTGLHSDSRGCISESRGFSPGSVPAAIQAAGERAFRWRILRGCTPDSRGCISESRGFSLDSRGFSPGSVPATIQAAVGARRFRVPEVAHRIPGDSPRAPFQRPFRPQESGRFGGGFYGVSSPNPGDSPRAPFQRPFRPPSVRGGFGFPGILPGLHSSGLSGRRRCAAVSGSRGFSPGSIPAAIQAAGERAFRWRILRGCTPDSRGCISEFRGFSLDSRGFSPGSVPAAIQAAVGARRFRVSGDCPRAPFPRPLRPPESGLSIGIVTLAYRQVCGSSRRPRGGRRERRAFRTAFPRGPWERVREPCVPAGLRLSASSAWWKAGTQSVQDRIPTGTVGTSAGTLRTGRSAALRVVRVVEGGNAERSGPHSHGDRGNECGNLAYRQVCGSPRRPGGGRRERRAFRTAFPRGPWERVREPCVPAGLRLSASSAWWKAGTQSVQDRIPTGTVGTSAGPLRTGRSAALRVVRVAEGGNAERSGRHSRGDRGNECRTRSYRQVCVSPRRPGGGRRERRAFRMAFPRGPWERVREPCRASKRRVFRVLLVGDALLLEGTNFGLSSSRLDPGNP